MRSRSATLPSKAQQLLAIVLSLMFLAPRMGAREHVVPLSELHQALADGNGQRRRDQLDIDRFLSRQRVQGTLRRTGMDVGKLRQTTLLLSAEEHAGIASRLRAAHADVTGGELSDSQVTLIILAITGYAYITVLLLAFK